MDNQFITNISALSGLFFGGLTWASMRKKKIKILKARTKRFETFLDLITRWSCLREIDRSILPLLKDEEIQTVAIYGMRTLGRCIVNELKDSDISVSYAIDDNKDSIYSSFPIIDVGDDYPSVDAIIVTDIQNFAEIKGSLNKKTHSKILNLEDIVNEAYYKEFVK